MKLSTFSGLMRRSTDRTNISTPGSSSASRKIFMALSTGEAAELTAFPVHNDRHTASGDSHGQDQAPLHRNRDRHRRAQRLHRVERRHGEGQSLGAEGDG